MTVYLMTELYKKFDHDLLYEITNMIDYEVWVIEINNENYSKYKEYLEKECSNIIVGGRLGNYRYYDMDMTIASALTTVKQELIKGTLWTTHA